MARNLQKHTLNLREGDWAYLESVLASSGIATSLFVRNLISQQVDKMRANETAITPIQMKVQL